MMIRNRIRTPAAERLTGPRLWILAICSLAYLLDGLIHTVLGPLAPRIARDLHLSNAQLGPIFSANLVGQLLGLLLFPLLSERRGHRLVVIVTVLGFGFFQILTGLAQNGSQLFWARLITGFFLGGTLPSCLAMVAAAAPPRRLGLMVSILFAGYGTGATLAGIVGDPALVSSWRSGMLLTGVLCLMVALAAWGWLREMAPSTVSGAAPQKRPFGSNVIALLRPPYLLGTLMLWVLFISMLTISYCLSSWLPIIMVKVGRPASLASLAITIFGFGGIVAGLTVGVLIDRFGQARVLMVFMGLSTVLLLGIAQMLATAPVALLLAMLALYGFFALGAYAGINIVLANFYPHAMRAIGIGVTKSVGRVGTIIAPVLIGLALTAGMDEIKVLSLFALPTAISAIAIGVIGAVQRATDNKEKKA